MHQPYGEDKQTVAKQKHGYKEVAGGARLAWRNMHWTYGIARYGSRYG